MLKTNPWEEHQQSLWLHASLILLTQNAKRIWRLEANESALRGKALELGVVHTVIIYNCVDKGAAEAKGTHTDILKIMVPRRASNTNTNTWASQIRTTCVHQRNASLSAPLRNEQKFASNQQLPQVSHWPRFSPTPCT